MELVQFLKKGKHEAAVLARRVYVKNCCRLIKIKKIRYVLLLAPYHGNLGDHAIALAEDHLLRKNGLKYNEIDTRAFDENIDLLAELLPSNCIILVHGGGFLGSIWPREEYRFRKILQLFPDNRIICFPQTVTFYNKTEEDAKFFAESKEIYTAHKKFTLFVRDRKSFDYIRTNMGKIDVRLVPDIVTGYEIDFSECKREGILLCMRRDIEKSINSEALDAMIDCIKAKYPDMNISFTDTVRDYHISMNKRKKEVEEKLLEFSKAKLVVTDRLHGMLFSAITNTPCIALNNKNGKVGNVYYWIKDNQFVKFINDISEFSECLESIDLNRRYSFCVNKEEFAELSEELREC